MDVATIVVVVVGSTCDVVIFEWTREEILGVQFQPIVIHIQFAVMVQSVLR